MREGDRRSPLHKRLSYRQPYKSSLRMAPEKGVPLSPLPSLSPSPNTSAGRADPARHQSRQFFNQGQPHGHDRSATTLVVCQSPGIQLDPNSIKTLRRAVRRLIIGATKIYRKEYSYPHRLLVIHYTGFEDEFICLDTENEKIYSMSRYTGNRKIADSFDEWLNRDILPRVKKKKR
jgi:hypothetical protein